MADERLSIILDARDNTRGAFASVKGGLASLRDEGERTAGGMSKLGGVVAGMAGGAGFALLTGAVGAVGGAFASVKGDVIDMNATLETSKVSWGVLLGSSEAAEKQLKTLYSFAATTPFEFPEVEQASRLLQTFGGSALNTEKTLKLVGDIAAGVGQPFADVAMWTGRMYDAIKSGRPFGEAAARLQEMGAMSGETRAKLEAMQQEGKAGPEIWGEFERSMGRFGGMMDKQSKTFAGLASTLNDTKTQLLATAGASTFAISTRALGGLVALVSDPRAATGAQAISDALGRLYDRLGASIGRLRDVAAGFRAAMAAMQTGNLAASMALWGTLGSTLAAAFVMIRNAVRGSLVPSLALLRGEFGRDEDSLESARDAFGPFDRAILGAANVIATVLGAFKLLADAVVTAREAFRGEWTLGGADNAVANAVGKIAGTMGQLQRIFADADFTAGGMLREDSPVTRGALALADAFGVLRSSADMFHQGYTRSLDDRPFTVFVGRTINGLRILQDKFAAALDGIRGTARQVQAIFAERDFIAGGWLGEDSPITSGLFRIRDALVTISGVIRADAGPALQFLRDNWLAVSIAAGPLVGLLAGVALPILAITTAVKVLAVAWAQNWGDIQGKAAAVVGWVQGTLLPIFQQFADSFTGTVVPAVRAGWDGIAGAFRTAADTISPYFATIREVFAYLGGGEVLGGLEGLRGRFGEYADALGTMLGTLVGQAVAKLAELATAFIDWVGPMIPPALEALGRFATRVVDFVSTVLLPAAVTALAAFAEAFWKWVGPAIPPLIEQLGVLLERLSLWFVATALPAIVEQLAKWAAAFAGWVMTDALPRLLIELGKLDLAFRDWITTTFLPAVGGYLVDAGKSLIDGFINGIKSKAGDVKNAVTGTIPPFLRGPEGVNPSGDAPAGGPGLLEAEPRQHGGPVSAGLRYLVGERGPELFVPRMAGMILPRAETEAALRAIEDEDRRLVAQSRALRAAGAREKSPEVSAIGARLDELERERMRLRGQLAGAQPREILRSAQPPILPSGIAGGQRGGGGDTITIAPGAFQISFPNMQVSNGIGLEAVAQAAQSGVQRGLRQGYGPGRVR